jgi:hypothetical protein
MRQITISYNPFDIFKFVLQFAQFELMQKTSVKGSYNGKNHKVITLHAKTKLQNTTEYDGYRLQFLDLKLESSHINLQTLNLRL